MQNIIFILSCLGGVALYITADILWDKWKRKTALQVPLTPPRISAEQALQIAKAEIYKEEQNRINQVWREPVTVNLWAEQRKYLVATGQNIGGDILVYVDADDGSILEVYVKTR